MSGGQNWKDDDDDEEEEEDNEEDDDEEEEEDEEDEDEDDDEEEEDEEDEDEDDDDDDDDDDDADDDDDDGVLTWFPQTHHRNQVLLWSQGAKMWNRAAPGGVASSNPQRILVVLTNELGDEMRMPTTITEYIKIHQNASKIHQNISEYIRIITSKYIMTAVIN